MDVYEVTEERFKKYGRICKNLDTNELVEKMRRLAIPKEVIYEPSVAELERLDIAKVLRRENYGEMEIQIGYCNGNNHKLNAVEYHRSSEINIAATDAVLILGCQQDITEEFLYDTAKMEAFHIPAGVAVELYATTLHYAPCNFKDNGFLVAVALPRGTNEALKESHKKGEDALLKATNKWLIGHKDGGLAEGAFIGLTGENLTI